MFSRRGYLIPLYRPPSRNHPGCLTRLFLLASGVFVCWFMVSSGTFASLLASKPLITFPFSDVHGVTLAQQPPEPSVVLGKPTLSASFLNRVLLVYHSPARGTGQALYDLSVKYGIDDAYALAFFEHESTFGTTGVATVTHSLGNIRCSAGYVCKSGYRAYSSWQQGEEDWYQLIRTLYVNQWHLVTVSQIVPVYAPQSDGNDVPGYIAAVLSSVAAWRSGRVLV
jgi:hypothetical protein